MSDQVDEVDGTVIGGDWARGRLLYKGVRCSGLIVEPTADDVERAAKRLMGVLLAERAEFYDEPHKFEVVVYER
jgi:hypothetical protein